MIDVTIEFLNGDNGMVAQRYRDIPIPPNGHLGCPVATSWILTTVRNLASISNALACNAHIHTYYYPFFSSVCPRTQNFRTFSSSFYFVVKEKRWDQAAINSEGRFSFWPMHSPLTLTAFPFIHFTPSLFCLNNSNIPASVPAWLRKLLNCHCTFFFLWDFT